MDSSDFEALVPSMSRLLLIPLFRCTLVLHLKVFLPTEFSPELSISWAGILVFAHVYFLEKSEVILSRISVSSSSLHVQLGTFAHHNPEGKFIVLSIVAGKLTEKCRIACSFTIFLSILWNQVF